MAHITDIYCRNCGEFAMNREDDNHVRCSRCDEDCCIVASLTYKILTANSPCSLTLIKEQIP